tara:strand:+ start:7538 stop:9787 length:2250 start_codon:yes stop_codon:yes gene_type:complete
MSKKNNNKEPLFFPQGFLVYKKAYGSILDNKLSNSNVGQNGNKFAPVAKLKGSYMPEVVVSKLVSTDGITVDSRLLNMENHKISTLVPEVRLYRAFEGTEQRTLPFYFPVAAEYDFSGESNTLNLAETSFSANAAVIENFSFTMAGTNPYQVTRKFLNASLNIKVDNLSVLFNEKKGYAMLADLFTIRADDARTSLLGSDKTQSSSALANGRSCRIVATLGYCVPRDHNMFTADEMISIEQTKQIINLYYAGHELNVEQDGTTSVQVKYTGYLETVSDDSNFDFLSSPATKAANSRRQTKSSRAAKQINKSLGPKEDKKGDETEEEKKERQKKTQDDIALSFQTLFNHLFSNGRIHKTEFDPVYYSVTNADFADEQDPPAETTKNEQETEFSMFKKHAIHYFTFGDFIDCYFKQIGSELELSQTINREKIPKSKSKEDLEEAIKKAEAALKSLKSINVLMADVNVQRKKESTQGYAFVENIADIPISLDTFYTMVWHEIRKQTIAFFDMKSFLKFSLTMLNRSLDFFPGAPIIEDVEYKMSTYSARKLKQKINKGEIDIDDTQKSTGSFTKGSIKDLVEYIVFHQQPAKYSKSPGSGNRKQDSEAGMFHLQPNKDRGLLKNISFSKISLPAREASLVVGNGDLYDELRIPHNATAAMYGNFMFLPGSQVYIEPNTLGFGSVKDKNSAARRLGFGGYYTVESISTSFSGGQLETTLNLLFNAFPETNKQPSLSASAKKSISTVTNMMGGR